jgi:DNA-binding HxlR family transcriptional regulator
MLPKEELPICAVATTVSVIGNKWKLLIIRELLTETKRFSELQRNIPGISQKVLTQNLRSMESDGIIERTVYPEVPPRVEYSLNSLGNSLKPVFEMMEYWGNEYRNLAITNKND